MCEQEWFAKAATPAWLFAGLSFEADTHVRFFEAESFAAA
jgi:hypothetical protein